MSSCRPYINNLSKNPRVQNELDKLHNSIFNRLIDSKLFNKWEDYHFLPTNQAKYAAAKSLISQINEQYKKKVAGTSFTKATGKEFVFVNVKNFVKEFEEGQSLLEAQQVDEFGDSVPMYNRLPDLSKLSSIEKGMYNSSPTEFISYLRDQLYGLSNGVKVRHDPPSEKSMVERYGKDLINLAKGNPVYTRIDNESIELGNIALNEIINNLQKKLDVQVQEVTEDEAYGLTENTSVPYNGERAFFFEGKIYLVKGKYGLNDQLHEVIHPFIRAVAKLNPELFNNLYKDAVNNPELQDLLENVTKLYPEYAEKAFQGDTVPFMEEFLVHVIEKQATGQLNDMKPETKNWLQRFWDGLKHIFRTIFNPKVSLAGLNANMSIEDLTKMLLFSDNSIDLRGKDGLWNYVFPVYNRSFVDEVQRIQKEKLNPQIETFFSLVKSQLERIRNNNNLKELKEILGNDEDGNPLVDARNLLSTSNKLIGDVENDMDKMLTFAEAISSLSVFSEKMINHVDQFIDRDDIGEKYKLGVLLNYGYIVKEWNKVISDFKILVPYQKTNPLRTEVAKISDIFNEMHNKMQSYAQNTGLVSVLKKDIDSNEYLMKAFEGLRANVEKLQKDYDSGNKSIKARLEQEKELLRITEPTEDNLKKWLAGEMGDNNSFSIMFESYTSNPNPIVGSFINFFYKEKAKLDSEVHETNTSFLNKIVGIFKKSNIDRNKIEDNFDKITDSIQTLAFDKDGTPIKREVKVFANQYSGDYQYQEDLYKHKLQEFKEKTPEYYALKKEYEQFKTDYMFDSSSDVVTKARQFWLQSDSHQIAKDLRQTILDIVTAKQQVKPLTEEERDFKDTEVKLLWRRYSRLSSLRNDDNTLKTPDNPNPEMNSNIAQIIKDYQEQFGGLYERIEIKDAFTTAKKVQEEKLKFSGMQEDSPEFKKAMSAWMRDNVRISNSPQFYEDRQKILDEISTILSKLPDSERKGLDIGAVWKEIFDVTKGYRDEDGQPIGSDLTLDQQETVKELQNKLDEVSENFVTKSGLTKEEGERYFKLKRLLLENAISQEESNEYNELDLKKKQNRLSASDNDRLEELYIKLSEIQRKIPTNYYIATFNNWMDVVKGPKIDIDFTATSPETIDPLLEENEEFRKWFMSNHRLVEKYDPDSKKYITSYERIYVWNRIIPNDEDVAELVKNEDYAGLMKLGHKHLSVSPSNEYTFYSLKKEYKTEKAVGVTIDNRGNWLPKPTEKSATPKQKELMTKYGISYAKDAKYQGLIYDQLKNNPSLKGYYDLNETYKQFSLDAQKEAPNYTKLWYEIPRMRKTSVEKFTVENGKEVVNNFTDWVKRINPFVKKETDDAYSRGVGNYDATKALVMTDLFGNVPTKIPIKYTNHIELENLSKDLGGALLRYNTSIRSNKMLHEINPIAQTLKETLGNPENAIKMQDSMSKNFAKLKYVFVKPKEPNKVVSNMYKAVSNFIEREFEGKEKIFEAGVGFDRFANHIMKLGAVGSLALSPAAAIRNLVSGNIQKTLEGVTGKSFTGKDLKDGEIVFDTQYMPALVKDAYKAGERSLYSQKFELFDPLMSYSDKTGEQANVSMQADLAQGKVFFSMQKLGEIHVQGSTFAVMMQAQKVPFTDPKTGEKSYIPYESAWELKNGVISLREGVDKAWDKYGDNFAQFKLRMQKVNEMLQGAYAKENQAEFQRYTVGSLAGFMRKYFVPMFMNRFSGKRINYSLGEFREGYYMTTFKAIGDTLKHGKDNWHTYTPEQRANVLKVGAEVSYSLLFALMISMLGFDGDDDDKYKKLKANPWIQTYAIYQLMAIKSETETFIPFWSMGFNEWVRTAKTPTVAFNVISKYMKMTEDLWNWTTGSEDAYYDKAYGVYDKGDVKFIADLYSLIGIKNWMVLDDPTEGVKAYVRMQRRY